MLRVPVPGGQSGRALTAGILLLSTVLAACSSGPAASREAAAAKGSAAPAQGTAAPAARPAGQPVHITVGWQPYYTGAWSALVIKELELWKKYLPAGSTVDWQIGLQGAPILNNMFAGKYQMGYMGDMPGVLASTKRQQGDLRILALTSWTNQQCNIFVVRPDAPPFSSPEDAVRWMNGKKVAVPKGSCTDRFAQQVFDRLGVKPAEYLNQNIEVITSNLRAGKLDAAVIFEPSATRVGDTTGENYTRIVATGADFNLYDAGILMARKDFMDQHPDVIVGWLKAEIEAQKFLVENYPANACKVAEWAVKNTTGYDKKKMWFALYGLMELGKSKERGVRTEARLAFDDEAKALFKQSSDFLLNAKVMSEPMPDDAIVQGPLQQAMKELGVKAPLGSVPRYPVGEYPCG